MCSFGSAGSLFPAKPACCCGRRDGEGAPALVGVQPWRQGRRKTSPALYDLSCRAETTPRVQPRGAEVEREPHRCPVPGTLCTGLRRFPAKGQLSTSRLLLGVLSNTHLVNQPHASSWPRPAVLGMARSVPGPRPGWGPQGRPGDPALLRRPVAPLLAPGRRGPRGRGSKGGKVQTSIENIPERDA